MNQTELANELKLARGTVNRILNGKHEGVAQETIDEVMQAAEAAGYFTERPSMHSIARDLGLSYISVRTAFRGSEHNAKISEDTKARILAYAKEVGYTPPPLKRRPR